ncbi:hypothetical protein AXG93_4735s1080 [Marchantia polymorpha subsp. ruderalis]|uniref:Uncharacterized protein n=1 Tax=Marchantia polymorpha subsp. ruderalis TaxID=1480154 RepID=A0A176WQW5_MARPO|nr:hypothetical protein AXG93_4735s1080 [Marchantia polymorpha subsp. ruderalis]
MRLQRKNSPSAEEENRKKTAEACAFAASAFVASAFGTSNDRGSQLRAQRAEAELQLAKSESAARGEAVGVIPFEVAGRHCEPRGRGDRSVAAARTA